MIADITQNLQKGIQLLKTISDQQYSDTSVAPYHSSIGCHIRHVLDVFSCVFIGLENNQPICLHIRERNENAEQKTEAGIAYIETIIKKLNEIKSEALLNKVWVSDNLGNGVETVSYSLAAILVQAHSHAIHHYASIGYLIYQLGIELPDNSFGFNPTTPKKIVV